jgi:hypothetical protein
VLPSAAVKTIGAVDVSPDRMLAAFETSDAIVVRSLGANGSAASKKM